MTDRNGLAQNDARETAADKLTNHRLNRPHSRAARPRFEHFHCHRTTDYSVQDFDHQLSKTRRRL